MCVCVCVQVDAGPVHNVHDVQRRLAELELSHDRNQVTACHCIAWLSLSAFASCYDGLLMQFCGEAAVLLFGRGNLEADKNEACITTAQNHLQCQYRGIEKCKACQRRVLILTPTERWCSLH